MLRTEWLTPRLIRVVLGGPELADLEVGEYTDHYVKLVFPRPGVEYPRPLDLEAVRAELPPDQWPRTRAYTVRAFDPAALELTIDFVYHGDTGLGGPWAAAARRGDEISFLGPGGAYAPDPAADWHLLVGDTSALPAIAAAVERLPHAVPARVLVEVADAEEELKLDASGDVEVVWVHRAGRPFGEALVEEVRARPLPGGRGQAFVHGEAHFVRNLRRWLRVENQMAPEQLSISGYWRCDVDDEGWRASKKEWNARIDREEEQALR
ncbi:siderophore-interacting protein [Wenjunlia vitaminophila]|uniref:siderophore-interacting protein n=1 Tax=Wenjunlia vitaminophila TaxID=76728 RepID=UPI00037E2AD3